MTYTTKAGPWSENNITGTLDKKLKIRHTVRGGLPVNDSVLMQVLEAEDDAGGVEDRPGFREHVRVDVHHEVPARSVLHHEADMTLKLFIFTN